MSTKLVNELEKLHQFLSGAYVACSNGNAQSVLELACDRTQELIEMVRLDMPLSSPINGLCGHTKSFYD